MDEPHTTSRSAPTWLLTGSYLAASTYLWIVISSLLLIAAARASGPVAVITSGSMNPTIRTGDIVVHRALTADEPEIGQIVTATTADGWITHRVHSARRDGTWLLKGDANISPDSTKIARDHIVGAGRWVIPTVGTPTAWAATHNYAALAAWLAATVLSAAAVATPPPGVTARSRT